MAMITVEEQQTALEPVFTGITGITTYLDEIPPSVATRDLPIIFLIPREATYDTSRGDIETLHIRREWEARLLVKDVTEGRWFEAEQLVKPFLTRMPVELMKNPTIYLADRRAFTVDLDGGGDTGTAAIMPHGDRAYAGSAFRFYTEVEYLIEPETF